MNYMGPKRLIAQGLCKAKRTSHRLRVMDPLTGTAYNYMKRRFTLSA